MTYKELYTTLSSVGIPVAYNHFDNSTPQVPPFICFLLDESNDFLADNINYQPIRSLSIELYTANKDYALEQTIEELLTSNEMPFSRSETYLESEDMFMVIYETDIIITEEKDNVQ